MAATSAGKLQILFFSHYFPPEGNAPASRTYETCRRWVRQGHQVTVITCAPNVPEGKVYPGYSNRLVQRETIDGIRVERVWTYMAANRGKRRRALNYFSYMITATLRALFLPRPQLIIATSPQFFCGWAGTITSYLTRLPLVLEIRDIWPDSIVALGAVRSSRSVALLQWMERTMYRSATRIVTVGDGYRRRLLERNVPDEKISVVTNGVDKEIFVAMPDAVPGSAAGQLPASEPPSLQLRDELGLNGQFICSYVGTIGMACGLEVVLRAARLLEQAGRRDIVFLLVGDGALRRELEQRAKRDGLQNVIFTGRQAKARIPGYLTLSDCCLVHLRKNPTFETVLPSKIFEALAMRRPVVLGVEGDAAGVLRQSGGGICIQPENEQQLIDAVTQLKSNPAQRAQMGQSGHDYVHRHYDRETLAEDYLRVIQSVVAEELGA